MYVALSVCCSSVSSNIIVTGFDLVDKVKSVVKDFVLLIFTHQSCAQLDNMLVASWSRTLAVVAYSSVIHRTKSSAYIPHFRFDSALVNSSYDNGEFITVDTSSDSVTFLCSVRTYFCLCSSTGILLASL